MTYHYEITVNLDPELCAPSISRPYFKTIDKYDAAGTGHKDGTSTISFNSHTKVSIDEIAKDIGDLEILAFEETKVKI